MPGGSRIRLDLETADGRLHSIILPFNAPGGLLIPRMLQAALDERRPDGLLRVAQFLDR